MKAAGIEFVEIGLRNVVALTDAEFDQLVARSRALGLPVRAAINFLPPELKVVGPDVDVPPSRRYLARAFARAQRLGLKTVVFGSGKSRSFPDGLRAERGVQAAGRVRQAGRRPGQQARASSSASSRSAPTRPTPSTRWPTAMRAGARRSAIATSSWSSTTTTSPWPASTRRCCWRRASTCATSASPTRPGGPSPWPRPSPTTPPSSTP